MAYKDQHLVVQLERSMREEPRALQTFPLGWDGTEYVGLSFDPTGALEVTGGGGGGGTEYTEGVDPVSGQEGTLVLFKASDGTTGVAGNLDANGYLHVNAQGAAAIGAAASGAPVMVGVQDSAGNVQYLQGAADGDLITHIHSGTIAGGPPDGIDNSTIKVPLDEADTGQYGFPVLPYLYESLGDDWSRMRGDETDGVWANIKSSVLPSGAATEAKQDIQETTLNAIQTSVEIMDDWDESDRAKVNPIAGQAGVAAGAGDVDALTQRVVLANPDAKADYEIADTVANATVVSDTVWYDSLVLTGNAREITMYNRFDHDIDISFDEGSTVHWILPAGETKTWHYDQMRLFEDGSDNTGTPGPAKAIQIRMTGSDTPNIGNVYACAVIP